MKRHVTPVDDLVCRAERALADHLAASARRAAAGQLGLPPEAPPPPPPQAERGSAGKEADAGSRRRRLRAPSPPPPSPFAVPEPLHVWRVCPWEEAPPAAAAPEARAPAAGAPAPAQRSAARVLFALRRSELAAALGEDALAAWAALGAAAGGVAVPARASAALSAAQWRLEPFRPGCRSPGLLRASGEAPSGWQPPPGPHAAADAAADR